MAGTDKTRNQVLGPAPIVVLVNPQLGENIGTAARAMANFGLHELRQPLPLPLPGLADNLNVLGWNRQLHFFRPEHGRCPGAPVPR